MTDQQIDTLSLDELRVECAKASGWRRGWEALAPDYPRDTAACAELRKSLTMPQKLMFVHMLAAAQFCLGYTEHEGAYVLLRDVFGLIDATPEEQCRAYLKAYYSDNR